MGFNKSRIVVAVILMTVLGFSAFIMSSEVSVATQISDRTDKTLFTERGDDTCEDFLDTVPDDIGCDSSADVGNRHCGEVGVGDACVAMCISNTDGTDGEWLVVECNSGECQTAVKCKPESAIVWNRALR